MLSYPQLRLNRRDQKVKPIGQNGRTGGVGVTSDPTVRCTRRHLTSRSEGSLSLIVPLYLLLWGWLLSLHNFLQLNLSSVT